MKKVIIIEPNSKIIPNGMTLVGSYQSAPGKLRILVSETTFVEVSDMAKDNPSPISLVLTPERPNYKFEYSDEDEDLSNVVTKYWGEHPLLVRNGKPTAFTKAGMFNMYDEMEKVSDSYDVWKLALDVMNKVDSMSDNELRDVWYYYGLSPVDKKRDELIIKLGHSIDGIAVKDLTPTKTSKFIEVFSQETESEREYIITLRKALMLSIIMDKMEGNRHNFYHGSVFVGTSFNDLLAYAKREEKIYKESILRRVNDQEALANKTVSKPEDLGGKQKVKIPGIDKM
jgi:hypothetical protein